MVTLSSSSQALGKLSARLRRLLLLLAAPFLLLCILYMSCTARVLPSEYGVMQRRLGSNSGIVDQVHGPGLYFVGPGTTLHTFPRTLHILEASNDRQEARRKANNSSVVKQVDAYFDERTRLLGQDTHRTIDALTVQTSDGYSVTADVSLLYTVKDPVKIAREFGFSTAYVDGFVINTFRNGVLSTLGAMNAEDFFGEEQRVKAVSAAEAALRERFAARGFEVENLVVGNYSYAPNYEKSLHDKKVAVQLTEKNRKQAVVNEERARLQQLDSQGNANITIAESEVAAKISTLLSEAELYASETRAAADRQYGLAQAEAKRLKADALNVSGGRYVVALEIAKMFDAVDRGVMTPEQFLAFIRQSWVLIGLSPGGPAPAAAPAGVAP
jgi:regulator of protease activity HflC (stomatin/prohibitin superfamily)